MKKWKIISQETVCDFKLFKFYKRDLLNQRKNSHHHFYIMDTADWVNIVPVTPEGNIILVKQYRAGIDSVTIETPGGVIDKNDPSPIEAAKRELEEETAYRAAKVTQFATIDPNPSFMANKCYFILAEDVKHTGKINFDPGEDIDTIEMSKEEIKKAIKTGVISHAVTIAALEMYFNNSYK